MSPSSTFDRGFRLYHEEDAALIYRLLSADVRPRLPALARTRGLDHSHITHHLSGHSFDTSD